MPLPYDDTEYGRDYGSGSKLTMESGSEVDVESGARFELAGTQVTSNASELNSLDGVDTSWQTLVPDTSGPAFTIGAEGGNSINVAVQLQDATGTSIASSKVVLAYLSDSAVGDGIAGSAPNGDIAIGTDGTILLEHTADKVFLIWTESDGQFDIDIGESGADTWYLCVVIGTNLYVSDAITFS